MIEQKPEQTIWHSLQTLDRRWLYLILVILVMWQVIAPLRTANVVSPPAEDMYTYLSSLQPGDFIVVESDWTNSTRGESRGHFESLMRLLMRKKVRFVLTSIDPQAPQVARDVLEMLVKEPGNNNYKEGQDYAIAGYYPNAEGHVNGMATRLVDELATKIGRDSAVLTGINDLRDAKAVVLVTASSSINRWYERIRGKTRIGLFCTAVMAAENYPYYVSGQLFGLVVGAKGAYDMETLLAKEFTDPQFKNYGSGLRYMSPLAFALGLLILAVIAGNVAMFRVKKMGARQ